MEVYSRGLAKCIMSHIDDFLCLNANCKSKETRNASSFFCNTCLLSLAYGQHVSDDNWKLPPIYIFQWYVKMNIPCRVEVLYTNWSRTAYVHKWSDGGCLLTLALQRVTKGNPWTKLQGKSSTLALAMQGKILLMCYISRSKIKC